MMKAGRWTCPACGEPVGAQFSHCWKCGGERGAVPPDGAKVSVIDAEREAEEAVAARRSKGPESWAPAPPRLIERKSILWLEVLVVFLLAVVPDIARSIRYLLDPYDPDSLEDSIWLCIRSLQVGAPVLYIVARSRRRPSHFGLTRPRWALDGFLAVLTFAFDLASSMFLLAALEHVFPGEYYEVPSPSGSVETVLFLAAMILNAFAEELSMRGYLIPRLEALLGSAWPAVLVSSILFASYHIYQGPAGALSILLVGILFGSVFAVTRRLWPLVLAHAAWNIVWHI